MEQIRNDDYYSSFKKDTEMLKEIFYPKKNKPISQFDFHYVLLKACYGDYFILTAAITTKNFNYLIHPVTLFFCVLVFSRYFKKSFSEHYFSYETLQEMFYFNPFLYFGFILFISSDIEYDYIGYFCPIDAFSLAWHMILSYSIQHDRNKDAFKFYKIKVTYILSIIELGYYCFIFRIDNIVVRYALIIKAIHCIVFKITSIITYFTLIKKDNYNNIFCVEEFSIVFLFKIMKNVFFNYEISYHCLFNSSYTYILLKRKKRVCYLLFYYAFY